MVSLQNVAVTFVGLALVGACGKSVKKKDPLGAQSLPTATTTPAGNADSNRNAPSPQPSTSPAPDDDDDLTPTSSPNPSTSPSPGTSPAPSTPTPDVGFEMLKDFVTPGGAQSGFLEDGGVYFAPNTSVFFAMSYRVSGNETKAVAEMYAKNAADFDKAEYISAFHTGTCSNIGPRYQHVPGDATPGKSEFLIVLKGTGAKRAGAGIAQFALPGNLVFVVQFKDQSQCLNFAPAK